MLAGHVSTSPRRSGGGISAGGGWDVMGVNWPSVPQELVSTMANIETNTFGGLNYLDVLGW